MRKPISTQQPAAEPAMNGKVIPPKRPLRPGAPAAADHEETVPSEAFLRRIHETTRRAFPAAPAVARMAPPPKKEHVDALALELWASGELPDRRYFDRWKAHMAECARCAERMNDADRRRAG